MNVRTGILAAGLVVLLASCGSAQEPDVQRAAAMFETAVADQDSTAACKMLAPRTRQELEQSAGRPCASAFASEDVPAGGALRDLEVFGTMAIARFRSDTVFLARFGGSWKVMAASCTPVADSPYECTVKGA